MPFDSGSVSFRLYHLPRALPEDALDGFRARVAPSLEYLKEEPVYGWVTGRHLLDRQLDEVNAFYGGYLRLCLLQAERKIPTSLMRAEMKQEELVRLTISGNEYISRRERSEIKEELSERLLPQMPPQLKGYTFVHRQGEPWIFAETLGEKQVDVFSSYFRDAVGFMPEIVTPESAAISCARVDSRDLTPCSFSEEVDDALASDIVGHDFLTWLWYSSETNQDAISAGRSGKIGLMIEGPLVFVREGGGAHETALRKGNPMVSSEAKACLLAGKKLARAKVALVKGEAVWSFNFDADTFAFRSVKLPPPEEALDPVSRFQDRMQKLEILVETWMELYKSFLELRGNRDAWPKVRKDLRAWVRDRNAVH